MHFKESVSFPNHKEHVLPDRNTYADYLVFEIFLIKFKYLQMQNGLLRLSQKSGDLFFGELIKPVLNVSQESLDLGKRSIGYSD